MRVVWRHHAASFSLASRLHAIARMKGMAPHKEAIIVKIATSAISQFTVCCVQQETLVNTFHMLIAIGTFFKYHQCCEISSAPMQGCNKEIRS